MAFKLTAADKKAVNAFTDKKASNSGKLRTDGQSLRILGFAGGVCCYWKAGKIRMADPYSRAMQTVQRAVKKAAPKNQLEGLAEGYDNEEKRLLRGMSKSQLRSVAKHWEAEYRKSRSPEDKKMLDFVRGLLKESVTMSKIFTEDQRDELTQLAEVGPHSPAPVAVGDTLVIERLAAFGKDNVSGKHIRKVVTKVTRRERHDGRVSYSVSVKGERNPLSMQGGAATGWFLYRDRGAHNPTKYRVLEIRHA